MKEKEAYHCSRCGKYVTMEEAGGKIPECCGNEMESIPLRDCMKDPAFAEHSRNFDDDQPCDDGVG